MLYIGFMFTTPLHVNEINIRLNLYSDLLFGCSLDNERYRVKVCNLGYINNLRIISQARITGGFPALPVLLTLCGSSMSTSLPEDVS